ncbi:MAG: ATP-binding cassette domain-containing protein [Comamonadaceae bacterium]|nr:MAG: ATP-binding cassette domain-containing protein [Comamonadaceae bacterium]
MLTLTNISVQIAGISVLRGISAQIASGATVALVGRNGAGKTTLLRTIMGVAGAHGGSIGINGEDITKLAAHKRPALGIGYAPENRVLFPNFTVEENLRFPCEAQGLDARATARRLEEVMDIVPELKPMLPRSAAALSGGQGKMAALGRALMVGTRLVMLDEPFQGLAPVLALQYGESLRRLHQVRPELAILITESNHALLKDIQSETLILERGALIADSTQAQALTPQAATPPAFAPTAP